MRWLELGSRAAQPIGGALIAVLMASAQSVSAQSASVLAVRAATPVPATSADVQSFERWIESSRDNKGLPFIIVDKVAATIHVFDGKHRLIGSAPVLLGLERGDGSVPGIGSRPLKTILPHERTTPAGRFTASLGHDLVQDILWVDYESALSLHRIVKGSQADKRFDRLASPTPLDNRISYGCINVPPTFYDEIVAPAFRATTGIVYILPEIEALATIFKMKGATSPTTFAAR